MAGEKDIRADVEADQIISAFSTFDHGAPSSAEMTATSGIGVYVAAPFVAYMQTLGTSYSAEANKLLQLLQQDLAVAKAAIQDLQATDSELATLLAGLEAEINTGVGNTGLGTTATPASSPGSPTPAAPTAPAALTAGDDTSAASGGAADEW